jgi:hypothetical protein
MSIAPSSCRAPRAPQRQTVRLGEGKSPGEGGFRGNQIVRALAAAEDLQRFTGHVREAQPVSFLERCAGQRRRLTGISGDRRLGEHSVQPGHEILVGCRRRLQASLHEQLVRLLPPRRGNSGTGQAEVDLRPSPRRPGILAQPAQQRGRHLDRSLALAREGQHVQQELVHVEAPRIVVRQQAVGAVEDGFRRRQGSPLERPAGHLQEQRRGGAWVARAEEQLCGQPAPLVLEARVCRLHRLEGTSRQGLRLRREELREHGVPRQRVPEPETSVPTVERDDLRVDRFVERGKDGFLADAGHRRQQTPVEPSPEHGGCDEDGSAVLAEPRNPSPHAL